MSALLELQLTAQKVRKGVMEMGFFNG